MLSMRFAGVEMTFFLRTAIDWFISFCVCHSADMKFLTAFQFWEIKWFWLACFAGYFFVFKVY